MIRIPAARCLGFFVMIGVFVNDSISSPADSIHYLKLGFQWNGEHLEMGRGLFDGSEVDMIDLSVHSPRAGTQVVSISPFPYRLPQWMEHNSVYLYSVPHLPVDAGVLKFSVSISSSGEEYEIWRKNGLYPQNKEENSVEGREAERREWNTRLGGPLPRYMSVTISNLIRVYGESEFNSATTQLGNFILNKVGATEIEIPIPSLATNEEWICFKFPDFTLIYIRRAKHGALDWVNRKAEPVRATPASKIPKKKVPFWKFWYWGY